MTDATKPRSELRMQQQAMVQLIVAGVVMGLLCIGAALVYSFGFGSKSVRSVAPVLGAFMRAGEEGNVLEGHRLLSVDGMIEVRRDDLARVYRQREWFDGFDYVRVVTFVVHPDDVSGAPETASATATVFYTERPPAQLDVMLVMEPSGWRIRTFRLSGGDE